MWCGRGAERLGLVGQIDNRQFGELFIGMLNGKKLTQNSGRKGRHPGWDLTFSAPKAVSVLFATAEREISQEIRAAHFEAVQKALRYAENEAGMTRTGKRGHKVERADLVFATFEHGTNRNQEPNLHTHAVAPNVSVGQDGKSRTVFARPLFRHKMAAGAVYRAELAYQLERRLGHILEPDGASFSVVGVSKALCDKWSSRSQEIRELAKRLGIENPSADKLATLAITSRTSKAHAARESLEKIWRLEAKELDWSAEQAMALISPNPVGDREDLDVTAKLAASKALDTITKRQATFTKTDLVRFTAQEAQTLGLGADRAIEAADEMVSNSDQVISLGLDDGVIRFTTPEIKEIEAEMLERVQYSRDCYSVKISDDALNKAILARPSITEEQREMVRFLTQGEGQIKVVIGDAGTGKTFTLQAVKEALDADGYKVRGAALSGKAAEGLSNIGIESRTMKSTLWWLENQPNHPNGPQLDRNSILIVDEAAMVDTRQMAELIKYAERIGFTLALVGDQKQLQAIELGGAFGAITERVNCVRLTEIFRQKDKATAQAIKAISEGKAESFLDHSAAKGDLVIKESREDAKQIVVADWMKKAHQSPEKTVIFCGTNQDATYINREIQLRRLALGELSKESVEVENRTEYGLTQETFRRNDRVVFTVSSAAMGILNGNLGTISRVSETMKTMTVKLDNGNSRTISLGVYPHVKLGYALTTYKGQGMTVENAYMLTDEMMTDKEMTYVQASRAELTTRVYTTQQEAGDNLTDLIAMMNRSHEKKLAHTVENRIMRQADKQFDYQLDR